LKQNNAKQILNKSETNPKQNKIVLFWVCFSAQRFVHVKQNAETKQK